MYWVCLLKCPQNPMHHHINPHEINDVRISTELVPEAPVSILLVVLLLFWIFWIDILKSKWFKRWFWCLKDHQRICGVPVGFLWSLSSWLRLMGWGCDAFFGYLSFLMPFLLLLWWWWEFSLGCWYGDVCSASVSR